MVAPTGCMRHLSVQAEGSFQVQVDLEGIALEAVVDFECNLGVLVDLEGNLEASVDLEESLEALAGFGGSNLERLFAVEFREHQGCTQQQWV